MTDLSTLLFAAARGARIQVRVFEFDEWINTPGMRFGNHDVYRVHPNDEHLMWGPLSRQYYEAAMFGDADDLADGVSTDLLSSVCMHFDDWQEHYRDADKPTRRMILLTIAYALRDEGM